LPRSVLISKMIGKELEAFRSLDKSAQGSSVRQHDATILAAEGLGRKGAIMPTDISLQRGAIVGIAGLLGSGRTELARLLYGADQADSGTIELLGKRTSLGSPVAALGARIASSTENRRDEGIVGDLTVRENLILAVQAKRGWMRPIPRKEQDRIVAKYIEEL